MAWWDLYKTEKTYPWNPTPGAGQRNDVSIPMVVGTPIVAPVSGIVLPQHTSGGGYYSYYGRQPWGGEVDVLTSLPDYPGGLQNVNLLHFDTINVKPGDQVIAGQTVLGTSGGQTKGGTMPSSPTYSTGPHLGVGVHSVASWNQMYNPATLLSNLVGGTDQSSSPSQTQLQGAGLGDLPRGGIVTGMPLIAGVGPGGHPVQDPGTAIPTNTPAGDWTVFGIDLKRVGKFLLGSFLISVGLLLFTVSSLGGDIAAAAATASGVPEAAPFAARAFGRRGGVMRRIGSGIRARGAVQGEKTLKAREEQGEASGRKEVLTELKEQRHESAMKSVETKRRKKAEAEQAAQGEPLFASAGDTEPFAYRRPSGEVVYTSPPKFETPKERTKAVNKEPMPAAQHLAPDVLRAFEEQFGHEPNPLTPEDIKRKEQLDKVRQEYNRRQPGGGQ